MFKFGVIVLLLVYCPSTLADTCEVCKTAYGTPAAGAKCAALKTYMTCLETSVKGDTGCPLATDDAATIETDYTGDTCSGSFTDTCVCQKEFWKTDQSAANEDDTCSAAKTYISCLKWKTVLACDGTSSVTTLATGVETRMNALDAPACAITSTCQCEINATKADISTTANNCNALTTLKTCLSAITTTTEVGCTTLTQAELLTDTNSKITAATCGSEHVKFAVASLIVSVVASIFL